MRLIIADDSEMIRTHLANKLSKIEGIEVVGQAENSSDAVEAVERLKPDVIILDIRMPKGDGFLTLQTIKRSKFSPQSHHVHKLPLSPVQKIVSGQRCRLFF